VVLAGGVGMPAALHKELVLRAFDPASSEALGYPVVVLDLALTLTVALTVVAAAQAVGTVLVIALLITPAATARLLSARLSALFPGSCLIAALCGWIGLGISYDVSLHHAVRLASGATIVVTLTATF